MSAHKPERESKLKSHSPGLVGSYDRLIRVALSVVIGVSLLDTACWIFQISPFKSIIPQWESLRIVTSISFLMTAISLTLVHLYSNKIIFKIVLRVSGFFIILVSLITIYIYIILLRSGYESSLNKIFLVSWFTDPDRRMALLTAINFFIIGIIIFLQSFDNKLIRNFVHILVIPVLISSYFIVASYIVGASLATELADLSVALNTGIAFCGISAVVMMMYPDTWFLRVFTSRDSGGMFARRLLPFIIVLPLVIGWLRLKGEQINLYPSDMGVVYVAITYTVILLVLVWITAKSVNSVDRKKQDIARELQESEERFKVIAEVSPVGMGVVGIPDGEFLYINPAYENHFGYGKDELLRKKSPDIYFDPYDREQVLNMLKENNFVINYEVRLKRKDGSSFWSLSTIKPIIFNNKPAYLGTFVDITLRKDAEEALKKSEMELIELNATKDKFFSIVAHDLKNPFTSLIGSSELLYTNIHALNTKDIKKLATILNDSAKGGYSILQNLLDWSRSQTGLLKISPQKLNLKELIEENILNLQLPASNKEISIINELTSDVYLVSDKNMINTVLRNLLSNAVKFTRKCGKVVISVKSESGYVIILVKDNGIGISSEKIEKLFSLETKNSMPGTENEQGTGLGLKLSKEFVEKLGGKITAESTENEGSEFSFTIPILHTSEKVVPGYSN